MLVRCQWSDQGWGNQKGMLSVVRANGRAPGDYRAWGNYVVCGQEPAPHEMSPLTLRFRPDAPGPGGAQVPYRIWARAGGGGGHYLTVRELEVIMLLCTVAE